MSAQQIDNICIYCRKECKPSDSRPFPNSKGKDRIHNKCQLKKNLSDRIGNDKGPQKTTTNEPSSSMSIFERLTKEALEVKKVSNEASKPKPPPKSHFFDLEAGVVKDHEKRRYLHHRKLNEIATRFDDNCHHEEAFGRAFDHTGKDLNTVGPSDEEEEPDEELKLELKSAKRKQEHETALPKRQRKIIIDEENPCWFCLSSLKVEKHLIIAIGEFCYVALAKGGLEDDHLLILPIDHVECINNPKAEESYNELEQFKSSLVDYFKASGRGVVFFERNFKSVHWQLQVVPVNLELMDSLERDIKQLSRDHFKNSDYVDIPRELHLKDVVPSGWPYLYWEIQPKGVRFITKIEVKGSYFPMQLARLVLTNKRILNCPEKIDWKKCVKSQDDYVGLVKAIKARYKEHDFT